MEGQTSEGEMTGPPNIHPQFLPLSEYTPWAYIPTFTIYIYIKSGAYRGGIIHIQ